MDTFQSLIVISIVVGTCEGQLDCSSQNIWITKANYSVVDPNMGCVTKNGVCEQTVSPEDVQYVYNHCMAEQTNMITCPLQSGKNVTAEAECAIKGNIFDPCFNDSYNQRAVVAIGRIAQAGSRPYYCECIITSTISQDFDFEALNFFPFHDKSKKGTFLKVSSIATGAHFEEQFQLFPKLHKMKDVSRLEVLFAKQNASFPARQILYIKANQGFELQCGERDPPPDSTHAEGNDSSTDSSTTLITALVIGGLVVVAVIVGILYWRRRNRERGTQSALAMSTRDIGNVANPESAMTGQDRKNNSSGAPLGYELAGPGSPTSVYSAAQPVEASAIYSCAKGTESEVYDSLQRQPIKQVIIDNVYSHCSAPNIFKTK